MHLKQSTYGYLASFVLTPLSLGFSNANVPTVVLDNCTGNAAKDRLMPKCMVSFVLQKILSFGVYFSLLSQYGALLEKDASISRKSHIVTTSTKVPNGVHGGAC